MPTVKKNYEIRSYMDKDRERIEQICVGTSDAAFGGNPYMKEALLDVFCHYYLDREPDNCFVAADEMDNAVGYVLCAENFNRWEAEFTKEYIEASANPVTAMMGPGTIAGLKNYGVEYPAHLHIDLDDSCQRQGLGTRLMDKLIAHLREKQVKGLCLCVAPDNEKGVSFYRKYGFDELERGEQEIVMGMRF